ncbi:mannan-binding protein [Kistimonas scapharcae]
MWNDAEDAQVKCPQRCANEGGQWTGHWWTTEWNEHSVCQCKRALK